MAGNKIGGQKARDKNYERYGEDFYHVIGHKGGTAKTTKLKGFAANPALAALAGRKGGKNGRRGAGRRKEEDDG